MTAWNSTVRQVADGEPVNAAITNRGTDDLTQRTNFLKEQLNQVVAGMQLMLRDVAVSPSAALGYVMYIDTDGVWKPALAEVEQSTTLGYFILKKSAYVQGMLVDKSSPTVGTIALLGKIGIPGGISYSTHGQHYLSSTTPGLMTPIKPAIGIPVGYIAPLTNTIYFNPSPLDGMESHSHHKIDLYAYPAGILSCRSAGLSHSFFSSDVNGLGWLPANHASFGGLAPIGAAFGYNIVKHTQLAQIWPPLPVEGCYLEMDGVGVPAATAPNGRARVVIDRNGIWWMDPCYGSAPWQDPQAICHNGSTLVLNGSGAGPFGYGDTYYGSCGSGVDVPRRLTLYFTRMVFKTDSTAVTQLTSSNPSLVIQNPQGQPASTGCLILSLNLENVITEGATGYQVLKGLSGSTFQRGPAVESVKAADSSIVVTGNAVDSGGRVYGNILIRTAQAAAAGGLELASLLVDLNQATEEEYQNILFLAFPNGIASSMRLKTIIPASGGGTLKFRLWIMGSVTGTLPNLSMTYRNVLVPNPALTPVALPLTAAESAPVAITLGMSITAYQYLQIDTPSFVVAAGTTVYASLLRAVDAYGGLVGLVKVVPILTA